MSDIVFKAGQAGRLDTVIGAEQTLVDQLKGFSRSQAATAIAAGQVYLNDRQITKSSYQVRVNDAIRFVVAEKTVEHAPYEKALEIYHEDDSLLVLNKPPGLSVHPGAGNVDTTLVNALIHHYLASKKSLPSIFGKNANERVGIVHRLDKDTSGVNCRRKNVRGVTIAPKTFQEHTVNRRYVALGIASPRSRSPLVQTAEGVIEGTIRRHTNNRKTFELVQDSATGKYSKTYWNVIERFPFGVLISCKLATGRTHQIRVHLRSAGCPVAGDVMYKGEVNHLPKALQVACERFGRQALHAKSLGFIHPVTNKELYFEAPLPADMEKLIHLFRELKGST